MGFLDKHIQSFLPDLKQQNGCQTGCFTEDGLSHPPPKVEQAPSMCMYLSQGQQ